MGNRQLTPEWFHGLVDYVLNKVTEEEKRLKVALNAEKDTNYYERPHEGESSKGGSGMLGGTFGEDGTSSTGAGTTSTNDPNVRGYNYDDYNPDHTDYYQGQSMIQQTYDGPSIADINDEDSNGISSALNFGM